MLAMLEGNICNMITILTHSDSLNPCNHGIGNFPKFEKIDLEVFA